MEGQAGHAQPFQIDPQYAGKTQVPERSGHKDRVRQGKLAGRGKKRMVQRVFGQKPVAQVQRLRIQRAQVQGGQVHRLALNVRPGAAIQQRLCQTPGAGFARGRRRPQTTAVS